jgi:integral membrane sensor domain MASE1
VTLQQLAPHARLIVFAAIVAPAALGGGIGAVIFVYLTRPKES